MLKLSVLIPARNEVAAIQDCLHSVLAQDYPKNCIEIIVADNGSTDGTMAAVKQLGIHCYLSAAKNISILRNELASMATGDIFVYLDADCIVDEYWASSGVSLIESNTKIGAVGGYIRKPENSHWLIDGWALRMHEVSASVDALPTGTFFISRAVFNDMRGFDNCLVAGEDSELSHRLINAGYVLQRTPKTSAVHLGYPDTVKGFCSRQIWQTRDYLSTNSGIKDMVFMLVNITLVFFVLCIVSFLFINDGRALLALLIASFVPAFFLGCYRLLRSGEICKLCLLHKVLLVNVLYVFSRVYGLLISLLNFPPKFFRRT